MIFPANKKTATTSKECGGFTFQISKNLKNIPRHFSNRTVILFLSFNVQMNKAKRCYTRIGLIGKFSSIDGYKIMLAVIADIDPLVLTFFSLKITQYFMIFIFASRAGVAL